MKIIRKLIVFTAFFIISTALLPHVEALTTYEVKVLVAYDEEWTTTANLWYGYGPETLAKVYNI